MQRGLIYRQGGVQTSCEMCRSGGRVKSSPLTLTLRGTQSCSRSSQLSVATVGPVAVKATCTIKPRPVHPDAQPATPALVGTRITLRNANHLGRARTTTTDMPRQKIRQVEQNDKGYIDNDSKSATQSSNSNC